MIRRRRLHPALGAALMLVDIEKEHRMTDEKRAQTAQDAPKDPNEGTDTEKRENTPQEPAQPQRGPLAPDVRAGNAMPAGQVRRTPQ